MNGFIGNSVLFERFFWLLGRFEVDNPRAEFIDQDARIFRIVIGNGDDVDPTRREGSLESIDGYPIAPTRWPFAPYASAYFTKSGLPKVMPKSGKLSTACFQRIMP